MLETTVPFFAVNCTLLLARCVFAVALQNCVFYCVSFMQQQC